MRKSKLCPKCRGEKRIFHPGVWSYFGPSAESWWGPCDGCGGTGRIDSVTGSITLKRKKGLARRPDPFGS